MAGQPGSKGDGIARVAAGLIVKDTGDNCCVQVAALRHNRALYILAAIEKVFSPFISCGDLLHGHRRGRSG